MVEVTQFEHPRKWRSEYVTPTSPIYLPVQPDIGPRFATDILADDQPLHVVRAEQPSHACQNAAKPGYSPIAQRQRLTIMLRRPLQLLNRFTFHTMDHTDDDQLPACLASARQAVEQLSAMYQQLGLEEEGKNFMTEIFTPMLASQPDPNDLEDQLEHGEVSNVELMKLSCAYVVGAISAETAGDHENAWVAVSHAQYWMGMAYGLGFMKGAARTALINRAHAGGKNRAENNYGEVKRYARHLAQEHLDGTAANAARRIKDAVIKFQATNNEHFALGEGNPEKQIAKWLKGLSFEGKRGPRKPNVKR